MALAQIRALIEGESYWKVIFQNGKELSELDTKTFVDPATFKIMRVRKIEWLEDIIGSGDLKNINEVMLVTPKGTAHIRVREPYSAFQFSRRTNSVFDGVQIKNVQVIGVVADKDSGDCDCAIWDQQTRELYTMGNNVKYFRQWRDGVIPIGRLAIEALDLRGIV